jgi:tetratricopeptide (TPR) repeat protein
LWNDWEAALLALQNEVEKQPRNPDVRLIHAHLLRVAEDWIAAYGEATEAVALAPQSPYAHALRSTICYHSHLPECAAREANVFVELRPKDAAAYIVLGHAKELQGNYEDALQAYAEAKRLHPGYSAIYAGMGKVYWHAGEYEKAVEGYEQAIRMDGKTAEYYCELGQVYQGEGYTQMAIEKLKKAKELQPDWPEILLALGNAYLVAEQYPEAIREYQELLAKAPDAESARAQLAKALRAQGHREEADQVYLDPATQPSLAKPQ